MGCAASLPTQTFSAIYCRPRAGSRVGGRGRKMRFYSGPSSSLSLLPEEQTGFFRNRGTQRTNRLLHVCTFVWRGDKEAVSILAHTTLYAEWEEQVKVGQALSDWAV